MSIFIYVKFVSTQAMFTFCHSGPFWSFLPRSDRSVIVPPVQPVSNVASKITDNHILTFYEIFVFLFLFLFIE